MGGGLIQLMAYGAQDIYLTGNPQITFFKSIYRRHTNFSCEAIEQTFNGTPTLGSKATVPITRNGDLVTKMWLKTTLSSGTLTEVSISATETKKYILGTGNGQFTGNGSNAFNDGAAISIVSHADPNKLTLHIGHSVASITQDPAIQVGQVIGITNTTNFNGHFKVESESSEWQSGARKGRYVLYAKDINGITTAEAATFEIFPSAQLFNWTSDIGYSIINSVELQIGGTKIDKHYGRWMHIWSQLTRKNEHDNSYNEMINPSGLNNVTSPTLYVPLQFFCCKNDGLALPLIALQYHDVRLDFDFATTTDIGSDISLGINTVLLVNYIYLDSEERKRFAQVSHEYLIEQLQFTGVETVEGTNAATEKIRLNFNHPVKELVWGIDRGFGTFDTTGNAQSISTALLQLNGHDRFSSQPGKFFNYVQPHTHHTRSPSLGICVYSFALKPEDHQPSGTCNFSRIDNAILTLTTAANTGNSLYVYGVNYNVLRIMSGMGGVAYSN